MLATAHHRDPVAAARDGDEGAFRILVEPHRDRLHSRCYRILGSRHDADDALQETLMRAWRGLPGFAEERALGPWLYRIATNASLDVLEKRRRLPPVDSEAEPELVDASAAGDAPVSPAERYERHEALEQALIAVLRHLPVRQRAALILSDALGLSGPEAADALDTTTASVYSALQRARKLVDRVPSQDEHAALQAVDDPQLKTDVERLRAAMARADLGAILAILEG
jgi:RNA polymerase sigma-70 factor (ECF subfamily)